MRWIFPVAADIIKIDVEGHEVMYSEAVKRCRPYAILEINRN